MVSYIGEETFLSMVPSDEKLLDKFLVESTSKRDFFNNYQIRIQIQLN